MQAKNERFEMRLDSDVLDRVDSWRAREPGEPSRSEAIRQLIDKGLSLAHGVQIDDGDRLILMMLRDIYKKLGVQGEIDPDFVAKAVMGGHLWGLKWGLPGLFHGDVDSEATVIETGDILEMWYFIESGYGKLSKAEKDRVAAEAGPFGKDVRFRGFDGNYEGSYISVAKFLIDQLDRFTVFKNRDLNCHHPSLHAHRQMLEKFKPMLPSIGPGDLGATAIILLLKAQFHPSRIG